MNYGKYTLEISETQNHNLGTSSNDADGCNAGNTIVRRRLLSGSDAIRGDACKLNLRSRERQNLRLFFSDKKVAVRALTLIE